MATAFQADAFQNNAFQIDTGPVVIPVQESFGSRHTVPPQLPRHIPPVKARFGLALDVEFEWEANVTVWKLRGGSTASADLILEAISGFEAQLITEARRAQIRLTLGLPSLQFRGTVRRKDS